MSTDPANLSRRGFRGRRDRRGLVSDWSGWSLLPIGHRVRAPRVTGDRPDKA